MPRESAITSAVAAKAALAREGSPGETLDGVVHRMVQVEIARVVLPRSRRVPKVGHRRMNDDDFTNRDQRFPVAQPAPVAFRLRGSCSQTSADEPHPRSAGGQPS